MMQNIQQKENHLSNSMSKSVQQKSDYPNQQQMLLQKTQSRLNQNNCINNEKEQQNQQISDYVHNQRQNLKNDNKDTNDLQDQIQRIKKIKNQYKQQKKEIQNLSKVVQTLKSQNKSLKLEKQSLYQNSQRKCSPDQFQTSNINIQNRKLLQNQKNDCQKNRSSLNQNCINTQNNNPSKQFGFCTNKLQKNIVNVRQLNDNQIEQNMNMERYLSPQVGRRIKTNSSCFKNTRPQRNINFNQNSQNLNYQSLKFDSLNVNQLANKLDQQYLTKNHLKNKKTVIASFVQQLKQELQQNETILQRQKKSHRQTKQKLQICLQQLSQLRLKADRFRNYEIIQRQNNQLKKQLQFQVQKRLYAQQKLRQKQFMIQQYSVSYLAKSLQIDRQLDQMDQIYFNLQKTLKI